MAKIYRPTYRKCVGGKTVTRRTAKWYAKIKIDGRRKAIPLTTDKRASEIMLADILRKQAMGSVGAIDPYAEHDRTPLADHVAEWQGELRFRSACDQYVRATGAVLRKLFKSAEAVYPPELRTKDIKTFLARYRDENGVGPRTMNWMGKTIKTFFAWMVNTKRMAANPFVGIDKLDERADIRRQRRPLTDDESARLIAAADASTKFWRGLTGRDRATLYTVALATGFRVAELASLSLLNFDLDGTPPTVTLAAKNAKNGSEAVQPLPAFAVDRMRSVNRMGPLWPGGWRFRSAEMIRIDLAAAGIDPRREAIGGNRVVDFHALRHTYVAGLRRAGVEVGDAMKLARHSDPKLTLAMYGQSNLPDLADAVNAMRLGHRLGLDQRTKANDSERLCATGGEVARPYNAPEEPTILSFSAGSQGDKVGERRDRQHSDTGLLTPAPLSLALPAESPSDDPTAWTWLAHSDPRLSAILAAFTAGPEAMRAALYAVAVNPQLRKAG